MSSELASLFECPVCFDYVLPPILQCKSGHLLCSTCRPKVTYCPTCRGPLDNIRNLAMEKVANTVMFPCKFTSMGCNVSFLYPEKAEHEETCEFRPFTCPSRDGLCNWQGTIGQVLPHLILVHKSTPTLEPLIPTASNNVGRKSKKLTSFCSVESSQHDNKQADGDCMEYGNESQPVSPKPVTPRRVKRRSVLTRSSTSRHSTSSRRYSARSSTRTSRRIVQNPVSQIIEQQQKASPNPGFDCSTSTDQLPVYYNQEQNQWQGNDHTNLTYELLSNQSLNI